MPRSRQLHDRVQRNGFGDPEWYKDAIIYELHVRSFQDSNADGIGDFPGLISRLDHLQDLGVTAVWLLPFYPSPLRDDGYDIADYTDVHPSYGTLQDFRRFLDEAHRRGIRVITELVVNHTSDEHPWFQQARTAPADSPQRDFYVWSDSPERYGGARIIFNDTERSNWTWDPAAQAYYWHRFYSHQPDLNFDNPAVFEAVRDVIDFWLGLGVDGMRLDAVPYLVEREGTRSENLRATHDILKRLRRHVDERFPNRMFLAEANQWPEDAAAYFGAGDESHMVFHFPLMPRLFMAMRQEDRLPVVDILAQTPAAPRGCQWALFLRNHDELTLEMVTEEERQYMYHVYATDPQARINLGIRRRLAPLVGNDRRRIELLNMLLFSLPGTPILYYGDEIGMGDNIYLGDRNGVRTPMQWSADRNAGFSSANAQRLFLPLIVEDQYHYQAVHVEQQAASEYSLLSWMKRLIALRRRYQAFGRGRMDIVDTPNTRILAYIRRWRRQRVLVVANLSRLAQHVRLDLGAWQGHIPVELFGRTPFPPIASQPYTLSLGPHACLWFELRTPRRRTPTALPRLQVKRHWGELLAGPGRAELEAALPGYLESCSPWASGSRTILSVRVQDALRTRSGPRAYALLIVRVSFTTGEPQRYLLALGCRPGQDDGGARSKAIAVLQADANNGRGVQLLYDAAEDSPLAAALFDLVRQGDGLEGNGGSLETTRLQGSDVFGTRGGARRIRRARRGPNALVPVGRHVVLKLFRQLDSGPNPEIELGTYLNAIGFPYAPVVHGSLHYRRHHRKTESLALGILQQHVKNDGEAWAEAVAAAAAYLQRAIRSRWPCPSLTSIVPSIAASEARPARLDELIGSYLTTVRLIATRTAALHRALAANTIDPAFAPEPLGSLSRRSAYQRMRTLVVSVTARLRHHEVGLSPDTRAVAEGLVPRQDEAVGVFRRIVERAVRGERIRCHGNLHLGQVLRVGDDVVFIDFEGEPGRPLYERRLKRSPLQDAATMIRSFHYAAHAALRSRAKRACQPDRVTALLRHWQQRVSAVFVETYFGAMEGTGLLPPDTTDAAVLLHAHLLERAYYELGFELDHRSTWVTVPLRDIPALLP
jgi:maltose alpha-D-glucosyltransferase / alpha-amylase